MEETNVSKPRFITIGDVEINLKKYDYIHNDFCDIANKLKRRISR